MDVQNLKKCPKQISIFLDPQKNFSYCFDNFRRENAADLRTIKVKPNMGAKGPALLNYIKI